MQSTLLLFVLPMLAGAQTQVPASYQDLYTLLDQQLNSFNQQLGGLGTGTAPPALLSAALPNADANIGPHLLKPSTLIGINLQLQALHAMGVKAVMVEVGFPMLYEPFFASQSQYGEFVTFYQTVAQYVRDYGMTLIVENDTLPSRGPTVHWPTGPFYAKLNWTQYQQARAAAAKTVAQTMQPDYLVVLQEPDTEAGNSGQTQVNTPGGADSLLQGLVNSVRSAGISNLRISAGVGTWLPGFDQFIRKFVAEPIDTVDIHIYPVNHANLPHALTIAQMAATAGKPVSMSETWLHKVRNDELGVLTEEQVRARDPFGFWAPLDIYFSQTLENFAAHLPTRFVTLFESGFFWAYLTYDAIQNLPPAKVLKMEVLAAGQANRQGNFSGTGLSLYHTLVPTADNIPPTPPTHLKARSDHPGKVKMYWQASTDNVGVAGYVVYRDGEQVAVTGETRFAEKGLASGRTYSYAVEGFDLAGNLSHFSVAARVTVQ